MSWFKRTPVDWELIDKTVLPSGFEQMMENKWVPKSTHSGVLKKVVIYTFKDKLSGRIKQTRHES